jgi:hypothetical protein
VSGFAVMLSNGAAAELGALGSRPRGMMIVKLAAVAAREPPDGLLNLWAADQVAACEVIGGRRVVLVYAVRSATSMWAALFGDELYRRFVGLGIRRTIHGRPDRM